MIARPPDGRPIGVRVLRAAGRGLLAQPRIVAWVLPAAWAAAIFALSSLESGEQPERWWGLGGFTSNFAHPVIFGVLALLLVPVAPRRVVPGGGHWTAITPVGVLWVLLAVALYGFTDELHQSTVAGRDASLFDLLADVMGAASVLLVVTYLGRDAPDARGLRRRLLLGAAASAVAAGLATVWGRAHGGGPWPF